jgi:hypothetical protein
MTPSSDSRARVGWEFSLCVRTDSLDPVVGGPGLGRVMKQSHDYGGLRRLCSVAEEFDTNNWMTEADLIVKEVFVNV